MNYFLRLTTTLFFGRVTVTQSTGSTLMSLYAPCLGNTLKILVREKGSRYRLATVPKKGQD